MKLKEAEIVAKLLPTEKKIKANPKNFSREHLNNAIQTILYDVESFDELIEQLKKMIDRSGVKKIGMRTLYTPRIGLDEVDKTHDWISDVLSYAGVKKRFGYE